MKLWLEVGTLEGGKETSIYLTKPTRIYVSGQFYRNQQSQVLIDLDSIQIKR